MPVKKDAAGRRYVEAQVEVPGTPEEVWAAIATGPGISSWFVPTEVDGRVGGSVLGHFSPDGDMESVAKITEWDPPHRFVANGSDDMGPDGPTVATEWTVEAKAGGTCVVRVVHAWFADTDDWDGQFEGHTFGWIGFFRILGLYLTHFRGQAGASFQLMGVAPPDASGWETLTGLLGLAGATTSQRLETPAGVPHLAGVVEHAGPPEWPDLLIRLDAPTTGAAHLFALPMGGQTYLPVRFYLYGDGAAAAVAREEPVWKAWMAEHFATR
jgi:uncharacterized protein YndB with AHSA1/START domain